MRKLVGFGPREVRVDGMRFELDVDGALYERIGSTRHRVKDPRKLRAVVVELQRQDRQREYDDYVRQKVAGTWPKDKPRPEPPARMHAPPARRRPTMQSILGAHVATKRPRRDGGGAADAG